MGAETTKSMSPLVSSLKSVFYSKFSERTANHLDKYEGFVFRCVNIIAQESAATDLRLFKGQRGAGKSTEVTETSNAILALIENPNSHKTKSEFLEDISTSLDLDGNAFIYRAREGEKNNGATKELYVLRPDWVRIIPSTDPKQLIDHYLFAKNGEERNVVELSLDEVIHIKEPNPKYFNNKSPYRGIGKVQAALKIIEEDEKIKEWNAKFFDNGAQPSGVLEYEGNLPLDQVKRVQNEWKNQYSGVENANTTPFLQGGLKWKQTGFNQNELAFIEQRKLDRDDILAMFGVPKGLLLSDDVNLANANTAMWAFTRFTIRPRLKRIEGALNASIVKELGEGYYFEFDNPVPEDREAQIKENTAACNVWMTVNEIRAREGLESLGEEYDDIKKPAAPVAPVAPGADPTKEPDDPTAKNYDRFIYKANKCGHEHASKKKSVERPDTERTVKGEAAVKKMIEVAEPWKKKYEGVIKKWFFQVKSEAIGNVHEYKTIKGLRRRKKDLIDKKADTAVLIDLLTPLQREYLMKEGKAALEALGVDVDFTIDTAKGKIIDKFSIRIAGSVADTTESDLKDLILEADAEGLTVAQLSAKISDYFDWADTARADMIADTESIRTANMANAFAWQQSGVVSGKEWYTAEDDRVCAYCDEMDGTKIALDENFFDQGDELQVGDRTMSLDYSDVGEPPLHPSCRCTLLPIM